jgi:serine/threonine protein kinase
VCGDALPPDAPQGLCPRCLIRRFLGPDPATGPEAVPPGAVVSATGSVGPADTAARATTETVTSPKEGDADATLTYSVGRLGGRIEPLLSWEDSRQLQDSFAPGQVIQGRYRIERELGRGGMGVVYLGRDLRLDRPVAIKVIVLQGRTSVPDDARVAALYSAFAEEARLGANLTHPAVATVYDYGFHDGQPFTVFEYLPGETLRDLLRRRGRLPLEDVRLIVGALAQALDFAHARRVVHRDLKPDNVRATEQGLFKVLDLGLAREFGRDVDWSGFAGTPAYASPEQASGAPCDGRADQYALALITFELLTGSRLFRSRHPYDLLRMHREAEPERLATDLADAPEPVRLALARALSKDPNARFDSCGDFAVALGCQLLNTPAPAPEILLETDVQRMTLGRFVHWMRWRKNDVHLALTDQALWSCYHLEVRRWPIDGVERVEPWITPVDDLRSDEVVEAEAIRQTYLRTEVTIQHVADFCMLGVFFVVLALIALTVASVVHGSASLNGPRIAAFCTLAIVGACVYANGQGLRRYRPWARRAALASAVAVVALVGVGFMSLLVDVWSSGDLTRTPSEPIGYLLIGILIALIVSPIVYAAIALASRKGAVVFSERYRSAVENTPRINPLAGFDIKPGVQKLRLTLCDTGSPRSRALVRFNSVEECEKWAGRLTALVLRRTATPVIPTEMPAPSPVVLMQHRPNTKFQLLGPIEAKAESRQIAQARLLVRAAMMEADAVIDVQYEMLPDFVRTVWRLTGTAVRAVDIDGRFEFRSRWYADRVARLSVQALALLLISLPSTVAGALLYLGIEQVRLRMLTAGAPDAAPTALAVSSDLLLRVLVSAPLIIAIHAWPIGLAALVRGLRWPQLVRPLALTIVAFGLRPVYFSVGLGAAAVLSGGWAGLVYHSLFLLDPANFLFLVISLFLGRAAWRADREYHRLAPDAERKAPLPRALGGRLALTASIAYAGLLAFWLTGGGYLRASGFRLPTAVNRKAATGNGSAPGGVTILPIRPGAGRGAPPQGALDLGGVSTGGSLGARLPDQPRHHPHEPRKPGPASGAD